MKCNQCKVEFTGSHIHCPLCGAKGQASIAHVHCVSAGYPTVQRRSSKSK